MSNTVTNECKLSSNSAFAINNCLLQTEIYSNIWYTKSSKDIKHVQRTLQNKSGHLLVMSPSDKSWRNASLSLTNSTVSRKIVAIH